MPVTDTLPLTKDQRRSNALSKIEDARPALIKALEDLDAPGLAREHLELGSVVIALDDFRSSISGGRV